MRDILEFAERCLQEGKRFAIAVVTHTWGSSPRPVGSMMAVAEDGSIAGSVSGGCVEGAVIEAAQRALASGSGEVLRFDQLDPEDVWSVGLSCGGKIEVLVSLPNGDWEEAFARASENVSFDLEVWEQGARILEGEDAAAGAFVYHHRWADQLVIVGGVHIAVPLVAIAKTLGFQTILIEPRSTFADPGRFGVEPDEILEEWPDKALEGVHLDGGTYVVLLTHDPKIDDVALRVLLQSDVRYIGALGSRTTQEQRRSRLREEGFSESEVARIHGPVGLDIGAKTPEEIAVSIMAEIVQVRRAL
jgi:xanthine dehydrogenase accessory factor